MNVSKIRGKLKRVVCGNFFRYILIGGCTAGLDLAVFLCLYNVFNINPTFATVVSTSIGIVSSFFLNAFLNFKKRDKLAKRFTLFYMVGLVGLLISAAVIFFMHDILTINANIAKIASIPLIVIVQFILNKRFSFSISPDDDYKSLGLWLYGHRINLIVMSIAAVFFFSSIFVGVALDDTDNMLGGKLILDGVMPYSGFFSHHSPGMYFLSAVIYPFTQGDLFTYRLIFNMFSFAILLTTFFLLKKHTSIKVATFYILVMSVGHLVALSNVPLGESLVSQLLPLTLVFAFLRKGDDFSIKQIIALSLILFAIPFLSLSYIFAAGIVYLLIFAILVRQFLLIKSWRYLISRMLLLVIPYMVTLIILILAGSLSGMYSDLFQFNSEYYAPMVGEKGGGVFSALFAMVIGTLRQVYVLLVNVLNFQYLFQISLLVGFGLFAWYLWRVGRKLESIFVPLLFLVLNTRTNIYNVPTITSQIGDLSQHAAPYIGVVLFAGSVGAVTLLSSIKKISRRNATSVTVAAGYCLVVSFAVITMWLTSAYEVFVSKESVNYRDYSNTLKRNGQSMLVNKLVPRDETVWIGPADFSSQLYLVPSQATRFTFYMPWIDSSPRLREEFVDGLEDEQPTVIVFSSFQYKSQVYNYSSRLRSLLHDNYFKVSDDRLGDYYFNKQQRERLLMELNRLGYETE